MNVQFQQKNDALFNNVWALKTIRKTAALMGIFLSTVSYATKPPAYMLENVGKLAELTATINICTQSDEYKKFAATEALNIHDIRYQIDNSIYKIKDYYDNDAVLLTYYMLIEKLKQNVDFKKEISSTYGNACSIKFMNAAQTIASNSEKQLQLYFKKYPKK